MTTIMSFFSLAITRPGKKVYNGKKKTLLKLEAEKMKRRFNITGSCSPQRHYMVRLDSRLKKIKEDFVD